MKKLWVTGFVLLFGAIELYADCTVNLKAASERSGRRYIISWDPVPGADTYVLEESFDNFRTVQQQTIVDQAPENLRRQFDYQASADTRVKYRLTAYASGFAAPLSPCTATKEVTYSPDATFRRVVQKSVIPLVGSTAGLNGSQFKTSVRLRATQNDQRGDLILRRVGIPGTSRDPRLTYSLARKGDVLYFDDIVAAFGQTGLGSVDIVPDETAGGRMTVPFAEVRLFNVTPGGTFGTTESQTQPFHWSTDVSLNRQLSVTVPKDDLRLNLGVRSFSGSIIVIGVWRGNKSVSSNVLSPSGDSILFGSAKDISAFNDLQPGDVIRFTGSGTFVPMYTLTDNKTNDPALFIPPVPIDLDVERYIER
ncbi:MAG TPA: hypothetical protein VHW00_17900 [Thermoanaerobaculia bacterium]|nr:hypothetical protein [Thermoanaerobaculia bacterium]